MASLFDDIIDKVEETIQESECSEQTKSAISKIFNSDDDSNQTNIMLVGATGSGKSSTINALFYCENDDKEYAQIAKVGTKSEPETKDVEKYTIGDLIVWDTPGLGDGTKIDEHHKKVIQDLLRETNDNGEALIDLVIVVLDGSTRDLGTSYKILHDIVIPELGENTDRILVALNQADIAMKTGRHWDYENNEPDEVLVKFLEDKIISIKDRIKNDSGIDVEPVYYCAGYKEESGDEVKPYNMTKLLYYILNAIPKEKRIAVMKQINADADAFEHNEEDMDYGEDVKESFMDSFGDYISDGIDSGAEIGQAILGIPGMIAGAFVGGLIGCVREVIDDIF